MKVQQVTQEPAELLPVVAPEKKKTKNFPPVCPPDPDERTCDQAGLEKVGAREHLSAPVTQQTGVGSQWAGGGLDPPPRLRLKRRICRDRSDQT